MIFFVFTLGKMSIECSADESRPSVLKLAFEFVKKNKLEPEARNFKEGLNFSPLTAGMPYTRDEILKLLWNSVNGFAKPEAGSQKRGGNTRHLMNKVLWLLRDLKKFADLGLSFDDVYEHIRAHDAKNASKVLETRKKYSVN